MVRNNFFVLGTIGIFAVAFMTNCQLTKMMRFEEYPIYEGDDLGIVYTPQETVLKVWSPPAEAMRLHLYKAGDTVEAFEEISMTKDRQGVWSVRLEGDYFGTYYTVQAQINKGWMERVPDPYAVAVGVNGKRAMIVDLDRTSPRGWERDAPPPLESPTDIVLYELHVRDLTSHPSSGANEGNRGKYLGLVEAETTSPEGESTGLDHLLDLGITHLHLLPVFDFSARSVDEMNPSGRFNWGYDPHLYNVPEGSYSNNPHIGTVRLREFKYMVKALHDAGISVVMDVVYNHTGETEGSVFNQLVPGYYYRQNADGSFSNASGCGNETASERYMVRKFMLESMKHWVKNYHIDGFRVDLMGIHDIETMNLIVKELRALNPDVFVYGEGWTAGSSPVPDAQRALKANAPKLDGIAVFSDDLRDALKGSVFNHHARGFVSGDEGMKASILFGVVGATQHPQVDYAAVNYSKAPYANAPTQVINYVSCHDNHTLYDKLKISCPEASEDEILQMHRLAQTIVLTSQGVPFLHAGTEMLRTKQGVENSFESPDAINQIDWSRKAAYKEYFDYLKDLIALRKAHPAFRMPTTELVAKHLHFLKTNSPLLVAYEIGDHANGDTWKKIVVIYNGSTAAQTVELPDGGATWQAVLENGVVNENGIRTVGKGEALTIEAKEAMIVVQKE